MELQKLDIEYLKYSLFLKRRFLPIFLAAFLGAFNDNLLRSGLVVMIAYSAQQGIMLPTKPEILVTICSALLMIPVLLFSSIAGPLADKYEKSRLVVCAKIAEVGIMAGAFYGFEMHNIYLLMCMLFISGMHSSFYAPIKFSILPDHLHNKELLAANGFTAAASYLAILLGLISGGWLEEMPGNVIGITAVIVSFVGLFASFFIPPSARAHPETKINFNIWQGSREIIMYATRDKAVLYTIFALSWFLLVSSVFVSQFANYAQGVVHGNNEVYILFLTLFSVGIAAGSLLCDSLLKGEISVRLLPITALGISVFTYIMVFTSPHSHHPELVGFNRFIANPRHWTMLFSMMMVALCGGLYVVPLYALLQSKVNPQYRSRIMAASNFNDSVFMTTAALVSAGLLSLGFGITDLFLIVATLNLAVVWYARKIIG